MITIQRELQATTMTSSREAMYAFSEEPKANCCSSGDVPKDKPTLHNGIQDSASGMLADSSQTTLYRIPQNFATYENPSKPEQHAELGRSDPGYMQTIPAYSEAGYVGTAALPAETSESSTSSMATLHSCSCGTGCQCLACPVHPGNETTQAQVEELDRILSHDLEYTPMEEDLPSWFTTSATDGTIAAPAPHAGGPSSLTVSAEDLALRKQAETQAQLVDGEWQLVSNPQYPAGHASVPTFITHPAVHHPNGNGAALNNGANGDAMPPHGYIYYNYPIQYMGQQQHQ